MQRFLPTLVVAILWLGLAPADEPKKPIVDLLPESVEELKAIQKQVKEVVDKVMPATVAVRIGAGQGSGVIISKDGHVLTAGHVSGKADRDVILIFSDGKRVKGKTLGANQNIDSGLIKISDPGEWPFVEMGTSADLKQGQWCISLGHPGGFRTGRTPVLRLGRVLQTNKGSVTTDCTLVGGDSGGPLFDLSGKVIGIHSRIGNSLTSNVHVPVDTYRETFDRLASGEVWGGRANAAYLGIQSDPEAKECKIKEVIGGSPAEKAGLKPDDLILKLDGKTINSFEEVGSILSKKKPGDEISIDVRRGEETKTLKVVLGKRG